MKNTGVVADVTAAKNHYDSALRSGNGVATMKQRLMNVLFNNVDDILEAFKFEAELAEERLKNEQMQKDMEALRNALEEADKENETLRGVGKKGKEKPGDAT